MMNLVIVGAGGLGRYVSSLLSREEHNVILIDENPQKLAKATWNIDIATKLGSGTDWQLLDDLLDLSPDFFMALTNSDETNLAACAIAKNLGYPRTIARVRDSRFLNRTRLDFARIFEVDSFIGPELLSAQEILKYMVFPGALAVENFAHGAVQLRTMIVPQKWKKNHIALSQLKLPQDVIVGLIRRKVTHKQSKVIFPHGEDHLLPGDEVTFIGEADTIMEVPKFLGVSQDKVDSVVIVGGTLVSLNLAKLLERRNIDVRLIEKDPDRCRFLAEELPFSTIINHVASDIDFFRSEKIDASDVFVACTGSDEVNLFSAMLAKEVGCQNVVVMLSNMSFVPVASELGIHYTISPRLIAANHILSQVLSKTVTSLISLYESQVEILEVQVSLDAKVVGIPLSELGPLFPKDFLIAMIQNRGRIMVAHGNRVISPGDTVIAITHPRHIGELEKIF